MAATVVLVHGAFAESASWGAVAERLSRAGHRPIAAANPLRGVAADAAAVSDLLRTVEGPIVLVGHSYGGSVISAVAAEGAEIAALVYVAAFAPARGESCLELAQRYPGSTLGMALQPIRHGDGTIDLLIARDRFHMQFCADLSTEEAALMAATQRPVAQAALEEPLRQEPSWQRVPSSFVFGSEDRNVPAALEWALAQRAGAARTVEIAGASHAVAVSHPEETAAVILDVADRYATAG